jgi:hypothetical protein
MKMTGQARLVLVWGCLLFATGLSLAMVRVVGLDTRVANVIVIAIAFVKVRYVGLDFMELRRAPTPARIVFEVWVVVTAVAIAAFLARS